MTDGRTETQKGQGSKDGTSVSTCKVMAVPLAHIQNNRKLTSLQKATSPSAALFMPPQWKTTKLTTGTELDKMWYVHTLEYYSGMKRNKL